MVIPEENRNSLIYGCDECINFNTIEESHGKLKRSENIRGSMTETSMSAPKVLNAGESTDVILSGPLIMECENAGTANDEGQNIFEEVFSNGLIFKSISHILDYNDLKTCRLVSSLLKQSVDGCLKFADKTRLKITRKGLLENAYDDINFPLKSIDLVLDFLTDNESWGKEPELLRRAQLFLAQDTMKNLLDLRVEFKVQNPCNQDFAPVTSWLKLSDASKLKTLCIDSNSVKENVRDLTDLPLCQKLEKFCLLLENCSRSCDIFGLLPTSVQHLEVNPFTGSFDFSNGDKKMPLLQYVLLEDCIPEITEELVQFIANRAARPLKIIYFHQPAPLVSQFAHWQVRTRKFE